MMEHTGPFCAIGKPDKREAWEDIKSNHPDMKAFIESMKAEFGDIELGYYYSETIGDRE